MDYDKEQHHAIPTKLTYEPSDEDYQRRELHYNYQPLKEGDTSFDVTDFCS